MDQQRIEKIENLVTLYNQICLYVTVVFIYVMIRSLRKKKLAPSIGTDFIYNTDCPICFNGFSTPIKSDCGHGFCLDCLYTYWKKPSWNNTCPLCRKAISNLKPVKEGISDKWPLDILEKISKITSKRYFYRFTLINNRSAIYSCFFCTVFLILWTYAVSNLNRLMYSIISIYNSLYDTEIEINM